MIKNLKELQKHLKITFSNSQLIQNAFVHRSYLNESQDFIESNERLEFLGDAVLELATTEFLFNKYPTFQEGMLTSLRSSLVKTSSLAKLATDLNFPNLILMSRGEEESGGKLNNSILANTTEAFIGALFLDQGLSVCTDFLSYHLFPQIGEIIKTNAYKDHKSSLQEIAQSKLKKTPEYILLIASGPDHKKTFKMQVIIGDNKYAIGEGKSKQLAQEEAAKKTLEILANT